MGVVMTIKAKVDTENGFSALRMAHTIECQYVKQTRRV